MSDRIDCPNCGRFEASDWYCSTCFKRARKEGAKQELENLKLRIRSCDGFILDSGSEKLMLKIINERLEELE